jgi:hypothetical protein
MLGCVGTSDVVSNFFNIRKASPQPSLHTYLLPFFNRSVIGFAILEKIRIIL